MNSYSTVVAALMVGMVFGAAIMMGRATSNFARDFGAPAARRRRLGLSTLTRPLRWLRGLRRRSHDRRAATTRRDFIWQDFDESSSLARPEVDERSSIAHLPLQLEGPRSAQAGGVVREPNSVSVQGDWDDDSSPPVSPRVPSAALALSHADDVSSTVRVGLDGVGDLQSRSAFTAAAVRGDDGVYDLVLTETAGFRFALGLFPIREAAAPITARAPHLSVTDPGNRVVETLDLTALAAEPDPVARIVPAPVAWSSAPQRGLTEGYAADGVFAGLHIPGVRSPEVAEALRPIIRGARDLWSAAAPRGAVAATLVEIESQCLRMLGGHDDKPLGIRIVMAGPSSDGWCVVMGNEPALTNAGAADTGTGFRLLEIKQRSELTLWNHRVTFVEGGHRALEMRASGD